MPDKPQPHFGQNLASSLQGFWQVGHGLDIRTEDTGAANVSPHLTQNFASALFSAWQERHFNWYLFSIKWMDIGALFNAANWSRPSIVMNNCRWVNTTVLNKQYLYNFYAILINLNAESLKRDKNARMLHMYVAQHCFGLSRRSSPLPRYRGSSRVATWFA